MDRHTAIAFSSLDFAFRILIELSPKSLSVEVSGQLLHTIFRSPTPLGIEMLGNPTITNKNTNQANFFISI